MASRSTHELMTVETETVLIENQMTGAGAANLTAVGPDIVSATLNGTGIFDIVFRHKYPQGSPMEPGIVGTTAGLRASFSAWDPAAGTATVRFYVGSTLTNPAATDSIRFFFLMRNSGRNPSA